MHSQSFFIFFFALLVPSFLQVTGSAFLLWCLPSHLPPTRLPSCLPAFVPSQGSDPIFPGSRAQLQASLSSINSSQAPSIFLLFSSSQPPNHTLHPTTSSPPRTNTSRPWGILFSCSPATSTTAYREFKASIRFWVPNICIFSTQTGALLLSFTSTKLRASACSIYCCYYSRAHFRVSFFPLITTSQFHIKHPSIGPIQKTRHRGVTTRILRCKTFAFCFPAYVPIYPTFCERFFLLYSCRAERDGLRPTSSALSPLLSLLLDFLTF